MQPAKQDQLSLKTLCKVPVTIMFSFQFLLAKLVCRLKQVDSTQYMLTILAKISFSQQWFAVYVEWCAVQSNRSEWHAFYVDYVEQCAVYSGLQYRVVRSLLYVQNGVQSTVVCSLSRMVCIFRCPMVCCPSRILCTLQWYAVQIGMRPALKCMRVVHRLEYVFQNSTYNSRCQPVFRTDTLQPLYKLAEVP